MKHAIKIMERRARALRKRIKSDRAKLHGLRFKSQRIRQGSPLAPRIGFFTDRLQELECCISLLKGKMSEESFLTNQNGDDMDRLATNIGSLSR